MNDHDQPADFLPAPPVYPMTATQAARNVAGITRAREILQDARATQRTTDTTAHPEPANVCPHCGHTLPDG